MSSAIEYINHLINETSPYLLQHAHNPVDWYPWGNEALIKAKHENKLVIVSIGYSACHWCHVMEHQSFQDIETADIMNKYYVCIKVDREERPDIDQIYMSAVQLMGHNGGWPLNCFTLPDGRPIYGGTYFPNNQWKEILIKLHNLYKEKTSELEKYATELAQGIRQVGIIKPNITEAKFETQDIRIVYESLRNNFDKTEGGFNYAPKFPLPNVYLFLLQYYGTVKDEEALEHVRLTLNKMAFGGIYDHIGGGFARYSTDMLWKVPHFEKMLYDNAQLVSLYSEAFQLTKDPLYKQVVYETLGFIKREMTSAEGGFHSALDADSEGEEGKFYIWKEHELKSIIGEEFNIIKDYYNINRIGLWEHSNHILVRRKTDDEIAKLHHLSVKELKDILQEARQMLFSFREKRVKPSLDDKQLTAWNALMLKGYVDAYNTFNESIFLEAAIKNAHFILDKLKRIDGGLNRSYKNNKSLINAYLEDYALVIEAFISLYQATFDEKWIEQSKQLMKYTIEHFYDVSSGMFYFTSDLDQILITRKSEFADNVLPASNSSIAKSLFLLSIYFDDTDYKNKSIQMLNNIKAYLLQYPSNYTNWASLLIWHSYPFYEVVVAGFQAEKKRKEVNEYYLPNKILAGLASERPSCIPLLSNRFESGRTLIYICKNRTCNLPKEDVKEALKEIIIAS